MNIEEKEKLLHEVAVTTLYDDETKISLRNMIELQSEPRYGSQWQEIYSALLSYRETQNTQNAKMIEIFERNLNDLKGRIMQSTEVSEEEKLQEIEDVEGELQMYRALFKVIQ